MSRKVRNESIRYRIDRYEYIRNRTNSNDDESLLSVVIVMIYNELKSYAILGKK